MKELLLKILGVSTKKEPAVAVASINEGEIETPLNTKRLVVCARS